MSELKTQIESWMTTEAQEVINKNYSNSSLDAPQLTVSFGRKYAKILTNTSVWGFVALTQDINKAQQPVKILMEAGWKAPAKQSRGNILDGITAYNWTGPAYLK